MTRYALITIGAYGPCSSSRPSLWKALTCERSGYPLRVGLLLMWLVLFNARTLGYAYYHTVSICGWPFRWTSTVCRTW